MQRRYMNVVSLRTNFREYHSVNQTPRPEPKTRKTKVKEERLRSLARIATAVTSIQILNMSKIKTLLSSVLLASIAFAFVPPSFAQDAEWDVQPQVKKTIAPEGPKGISGMVAAIVDIDENGVVTNIQISKTTDASLEEPVIKALKQWRFAPAQLNGKPIACTIKVPFKFNG